MPLRTINVVTEWPGEGTSFTTPSWLEAKPAEKRTVDVSREAPQLLQFPQPLPISLPTISGTPLAWAHTALTGVQSSLKSMALGAFVNVTIPGRAEEMAATVFLSVGSRCVVFSARSESDRAAFAPLPVSISSIVSITCEDEASIRLKTRHGYGYAIRFPWMAPDLNVSCRYICREILIDMKNKDIRDDWVFGLGCLHELYPEN
jgi:hypothetical protein